MRSWDTKPTSAPAARVCELRGGMTTTGSSWRINAAPVSCTALRHSRRDDVMSKALQARRDKDHSRSCQIRYSSHSSMYNTEPFCNKIRKLENKQDLEMELDKTQLHIIEWKWRTSPVPSGLGDIPVLDEDRMMTPNSVCAPQGKREAAQMLPSSTAPSQALSLCSEFPPCPGQGK